MLQPLSGTVLDSVPWWAYFCHYGYRDTTRRRILKQRDPWEVFLLWQNESIDMKFVARVSSVIASAASHPNSLFVPKDNFFCLVADYDGSFTEVNVLDDLQQKVFSRSIEFEDIFNAQSQHWNYLDFLHQIAPYS